MDVVLSNCWQPTRNTNMTGGKKQTKKNPPIIKQKTELPHCRCSPRGSTVSCNFQTHVVTEEKLGHMVQWQSPTAQYQWNKRAAPMELKSLKRGSCSFWHDKPNFPHVGIFLQNDQRSISVFWRPAFNHLMKLTATHLAKLDLPSSLISNWRNQKKGAS